MQGKSPVMIDDGVSGIGSPLKADDDVRALGEHIRNLSLPLVSPVGAHYRSYHISPLSFRPANIPLLIFPLQAP